MLTADNQGVESKERRRKNLKIGGVSEKDGKGTSEDGTQTKDILEVLILDP